MTPAHDKRSGLSAARLAGMAAIVLLLFPVMFLVGQLPVKGLLLLSFHFFPDPSGGSETLNAVLNGLRIVCGLAVAIVTCWKVWPRTP